MSPEQYTSLLSSLREGSLPSICKSAYHLHDVEVNQQYDGVHPYSLHLSGVVAIAEQYLASVLASEEDLLPVLFAAAYHDSIEDARLTYNDVYRRATLFMTPESARLAADIVFSLTNLRGRTRAERAGEAYYELIRQTPYAPFVKLCDRLFNIRYSAAQGQRMLEVYRTEWTHFEEAILSQHSLVDIRFSCPDEMLAECRTLLGIC